MTRTEGEILCEFARAIAQSREHYSNLIELGLPKEYARYVTPFAMHTAYTYTMNLRSLINFFGLRLCVRASPEMRELASKLYLAVRERFPQIDKVWCRGYNGGVCPENEVRDSPQGKGCPFKHKGSDIFLPTRTQLREGVATPPFDEEKFQKVKEVTLSSFV